MPLEIPDEYGYVILAATSTYLLHAYLGFNTGQHRRLAKIPYPNAYATAAEAKASKEAYLFNCAQRAHANFTENHTMFLGMLLASGLRFPVASAVLGVNWTFSRYLYMVGYCNPDKQNGSGRTLGGGQYISTIGLLGMSIYTAVQMVRGVY